jgi:FkbM family methyltransferase
VSWTTALRNELAHERNVLASYIPRRSNDSAWATLPGDLVGRVLRSGRNWEGWLTRYINAYASNDHTSIDVGANVGVHTRRMALRSYETIAFEPQEAAYSRLIANITDLGNVRPLRLAASSREGIASMSHVPGNRGASRLVSTGGDEVVATMRLDDLDLHRPVSLIKIDVEGHERDVLAGAAGILTLDRPVILLEDTTRSRAMLKEFDYRMTRIALRDFLCLPAEKCAHRVGGRDNV